MASLCPSSGIPLSLRPGRGAGQRPLSVLWGSTTPEGDSGSGSWAGSCRPRDFSRSLAQRPRRDGQSGGEGISPLRTVSTLARCLDVLYVSLSNLQKQNYRNSTLTVLLLLIICYILLEISLLTYGKIICDSYGARRKHVRILPAAKKKDDDRGRTCHRALWVRLLCVIS